MPIHGYPGNIITANPTAPTVSSASGVWTTEQQLINQSAGNWPMAQTQVSLSARFNSADSAYLSRTPASATNRKTFTFSCWFKISQTIGSGNRFFSARADDNNRTNLGIDGNGFPVFVSHISGTLSQCICNDVIRDVGAWYHFVFAIDTTQATDTNRVKIYKNGVQMSFSSATYPAQNADMQLNNNVAHSVGRTEFSTPSGYCNGYLAEVNFIDGLALTPAYFGFNDSNTGAWTPKQYTGAYGTNGFFLPFNKEGIGIDFLVIAGGGGSGGESAGGSNGGSGGGAGGYRTSAGTSGGGASAESQFVASTGIAYTVTVGAGGTAGSAVSQSYAGNGNNSVFASITSIGGGGGICDGPLGASGGSGSGGGGATPGTGGAGTANQGYAGGNGSTSATGGGGGAGSAGSNAPSGQTGGNGGNGVASTITGSSVTRGGGGGGGGNLTAGSGGSGGGGGGNTPGTVNTGGGAGGANPGAGAPSAPGQTGGSGVVIIKIPDTYTATFSGGVTQTSTTSGGFKIYTVTATSTTSETVTFS